ncbi:glycosyltransferase family 2 protein [Marinicrinis lubricantis]|uniref:Glycosyltransferase family 2 protein n=1 Tax=Marinicrinis lubricantis TaxID=2086470 RepID=A0ABW1IV69_9BACL
MAGVKRRIRKSTKQRRLPIVCSKYPLVSVIIPVMNESRTIGRVIRESWKVDPETEVIVVVNGSKDRTRHIAERSGARVIYYEEALGHDIGRSIGAAHAKGDILLFVDGDIVIPSSELKPFVDAIKQGFDVALNEYRGPVRKQAVHSVVLAKHSLNVLCSRPDLGGSSMTTIPHALHRKAMVRIGAEKLAVPPLAQAAAIAYKLNVAAVHYVSVGRENPRKRKHLRPDPLERLIVGDHLEAIHWYLENTDSRGLKTDLSRMRGVLQSDEGASEQLPSQAILETADES